MMLYVTYAIPFEFDSCKATFACLKCLSWGKASVNREKGKHEHRTESQEYLEGHRCFGDHRSSSGRNDRMWWRVCKRRIGQCRF